MSNLKFLLTKIFFIFFFFFLGSNLYCQKEYLKSKSQIDSICNIFLKTFNEEKYTVAINMLKLYSVMDDEQIDLLAKTVEQQMVSFSMLSGKSLSFEFIKESSIKDFLIKRIYLIKFEKAYLRFNFTFYLNNTNWVITFFDYSESIDDLF